MESDIKITCATHGETHGAFVCRHLLEGSKRGFHWGVDAENPDAMCPDAWCDECEAALDEAGEWTDELAERAAIKLVCTACYSNIRERNWIEDEEAFEQLRRDSIAYLNSMQAALIEEFRIDQHPRWDWHQDSAQLVFSNDGKPVLICDVIFVGSISTTGKTWLWSWANESLVEGVKSRMREVRTYGEEKRFEKLAGAYRTAAPQDGWEMTSIAARLLNAIGAYRTPDENGFVYMIIMRADWAQ
jgi:hypothetical protein